MVNLFRNESNYPGRTPSGSAGGTSRWVMLDHYEQHLRTSTSRNGRPYAEITIVGYMRCATRLANWLDDNEIAGDLSAACDPKIMNRFLLEYQSTHDINGTSFVQRNLRNLCAWLETECNVTSPYRSRELHTYTAKIHKPKVLGNEFITALLETCSKGSFTDVRDAAIIRLLLDGMRVGEVLAIAPEDVPPLTDPVLRVVPAKGELAYAKGSGRRILLEEETAKALQRWVRKREAHPLSRTVLRNELWLGQGSATPFRYNGVRLMLERRSKKALEGAPGHATSHMFRHTFAHDFRADGGSLDDLTQHMGWASYAMAQRYGKDMAEDRAIAAKREMRRKRGRKY